MLNRVILCIILVSMKKEKQKIELKEKSKQTLTMLNGIIIALLATVGLLNRSIGSFVTFVFYILFGNAYVLFFGYLLFFPLNRVKLRHIKLNIRKIKHMHYQKEYRKQKLQKNQSND